MNWQRWGIVAAIIAAVAAVWALVRNQPAPTVTNQPSPASGGVVPSSNTGIPLQEYQVNPPVLQPSPIVSLAGPADPTSNATQGQGPGQLSMYGPSYLVYNLGPQSALTKGKPKPTPPKSNAPAGCGCDDECNTTMCKNPAQSYTEGQGNGCMATSKTKQINALEKKYPGLWDAMQSNMYEAGVNPDDVFTFWQQRDNPTSTPGAPGVGTSKPAAPGAGDSSTAGNSRLWPGAVITGIIGHA